MRKSEKSKLIKALSALVEKNGPEFPSEHPTEMVEKLEAWLREKQPRYEYSTLEELTGCIAEALRSQMDGAFEEYCQEDDYYEPVAEDFEFERELREAAGEMGIEVLWTDYDGDISDYEMERHRW